MLVAWPPTISPLTPAGLAASRFIAGVTKPEAFTSIAATSVAQVLSAQASLAVQIALSDRIPVGSVVVQVDDGLENIVFMLSARQLMGSRGYNRDAGADDEIVKLAEGANAILMMMAPGDNGANGKRVTPLYVLATPSGGAPVVDGVKVTSHHSPMQGLLAISRPG
jgi:hypothetical protein